MRRMSADELARDRTAVIVDIRQAEERDAVGWVPGSLWRPHTEPTAEWAKTLPEGEPLVLVCMTGRRTFELLGELKPIREGRVTDLEHGTMGWGGSGRPLVRTDPHVLPEGLRTQIGPISLPAFKREVLSCFVATAIKVDSTDQLDENTPDDVYSVFPEGPTPVEAAREGIDRLAARAFHEGYPLDLIAQNCTYYHQQACRIEDGE